MYDFLIIGGGVIGCAIARELSRFNASVAVAESGKDVCSSEVRTGGVVCAARALFPYRPSAVKYAAAGEKMFRSYSAALGVTYRRSGCLYVCDDSFDAVRITDKCNSLGISCKTLTYDEALRIEPHLMMRNEKERYLYFPEAGLTDACEFIFALRENAEINGTHFYFGFEAEKATDGEGVTVISADGRSIQAHHVINCSGNNGGPVARAFGDLIYLEHAAVNCVVSKCKQPPRIPVFCGNRSVLPCPGDSVAAVCERVSSRRMVPEVIPYDGVSFEGPVELAFEPVLRYARLYSYAHGGDIIDRKGKLNGVRHIIGMDDMGITLAPALAMAVARSYSLEKRCNFISTRTKPVHVAALSASERAALVRKDKAYSSIVLASPPVTEGEVRDAVLRGADTIDGLERRLLHVGESGGARLAAAMERYCSDSGFFAKEV